MRAGGPGSGTQQQPGDRGEGWREGGKSKPDTPPNPGTPHFSRAPTPATAPEAAGPPCNGPAAACPRRRSGLPPSPEKGRSRRPHRQRPAVPSPQPQPFPRGGRRPHPRPAGGSLYIHRPRPRPSFLLAPDTAGSCHGTTSRPRPLTAAANGRPQRSPPAWEGRAGRCCGAGPGGGRPWLNLAAFCSGDYINRVMLWGRRIPAPHAPASGHPFC